MNAADNVGVTFVNAVINRGIFNGVINVSFGTYNFTPADTGDQVNPDMVVSARLRMDVVCAQQLVESLGALLDAIRQEQMAPPSADEGEPKGKPN